MRKRKKQILAVFMTLILCIISSPISFAANFTNTKVIRENNYTITECLDSKNQIIRTYERTPQVEISTFASNGTNNSALSYEQTKEMLTSLGMDAQAIECLSDEELEEYATTPRIQSVTSFCKTDTEGNTSYVSENEAIQSAAEINAMSGTITSQTRFFDEYMKLYYQVTDLADGLGSYKFVTEATWLTMPTQRQKDAVGSCAQGVTITPNTQKGYYSYTRSNIVEGNVLAETKVEEDIQSSSFANVTDNVYLGAVAYVNLPNDIYTTTMISRFYDFFVHTEYKGKIAHPQLVTNFNTSGTYTHVVTSITFTPSLNLSYEDGAVAVIDISTNRTEEKRSIFFEITYVPPSQSAI